MNAPLKGGPSDDGDDVVELPTIKRSRPTASLTSDLGQMEEWRRRIEDRLAAVAANNQQLREQITKIHAELSGKINVLLEKSRLCKISWRKLSRGLQLGSLAHGRWDREVARQTAIPLSSSSSNTTSCSRRSSRLCSHQHSNRDWLQEQMWSNATDSAIVPTSRIVR